MARQSKQADELRKKGWVLASEAAKLMLIHPTSIYKLIDRGDLEELRVGGRRYVAMQSIRDYLGPAADTILPKGA